MIKFKKQTEILAGLNSTPLALTDLTDATKAHAIADILESQTGPALIITYDENRAGELAAEIRHFSKKEVGLYPAKDIVFYSAEVKSPDIIKKRFSLLHNLNNDSVTILTAEALLTPLSPPEIFKDSVICIKDGDNLPIEDLISRLISLGFERREQVELEGQFALRGGILDIFTPISPLAHRLEFFGDEINSIRAIDILSQRSVEKVDSLIIYPMRELVYGEETLKSALVEIEADYNLARQNFLSQNQKEEANTLEENVGSALERFKSGIFGGIDKYYGYFYPGSTFFDYIPKETLVFFDEPGKIKKTAETACEEFREISGRRLLKGYILSKQSVMFFSYQDILARAEDFSLIFLMNFYSKPDIEPKSLVKVNSKELLSLDKKPVIKNRKKRRKSSYKNAVRIDHFSQLEVGDYIVHDNHGIGLYSGIESITADYVTKDYLKISYANEGRLYVPTVQMDKVQKYIGKEGVRLNRLGGGAWEKAKSRARKTIEILAKDLAMLYAKRNAARGHMYTQDTVWQKEFEEKFPFQETEDQITAIEEVKQDMESEKVMDRLICGDVGFGKTEIALRAAFKAVQDNKQVTFLVPTTILGWQHYLTFAERMENFPVNIEFLSRFRSKKEIGESLERIKNGRADIVIGTHRILSKDVNFKNLGLVIVDEEQRFGVSHKEKLKRLTLNVDVLTLTATPIPRTLHMSLSGLRDISLLREPPTERKTIQTFVLEYDEEFVKAAINRELARGGQIYYLHNRVSNISNVLKKLTDLIPHARISYAHGQMSEIELENVMMDFVERDIDILICTTIIETGLDIPNVNTIIIQDADRMGLAQLHQLRGRVGRSDKIAFAYLMYKKNKVLEEAASKRLQTIRDFTEFGSGFKVALKDLEIRGAGSLLGAEQHGQMGVVGYEMYNRLLEEALAELKGEIPEKKTETSVEIKITAFIPPEYIVGEEQRLDIYKKIAHIQDMEDYYSVMEEIEDRFGTLIKFVQNLLDIALLKALAGNLGIENIIQKEKIIIMYFAPQASIDPYKLTETIMKRKNLFFTAGEVSYMTYKLKDSAGSKDLAALIKILRELKGEEL